MDRLSLMYFDSLALPLQVSFGGMKVKLAGTGRWVEAPPIEGALVLNIGDTLSRWSNAMFYGPLFAPWFSIDLYFRLPHIYGLPSLLANIGP